MCMCNGTIFGMNPYDASCRINAALGGCPSEPLCSRIYRWDDSLIRTGYLRLMNRIFNESAHCERIYHKFVAVNATCYCRHCAKH